MSARNGWATILALVAGFTTTAIVGVAAKVRAEDGDVPAFIMAALFAAVLLWIPARVAVGVVGKLTEKSNG